MQRHQGPTLLKIGEPAILICADTAGRTVRAVVTVVSCQRLTCGCDQVTAERPGLYLGYPSRAEGVTGCAQHEPDVENIPAAEQVEVRDGFLYATDEPPYATDPATLLDVTEGDMIRVDHPAGSCVMEVKGVHRDEYGINFSGTFVSGDPGRDPFASSRTDRITKA